MINKEVLAEFIYKPTHNLKIVYHEKIYTLAS